MQIKKDEFLKTMSVYNLNFSEVAKKMEISRSYLWEVLEGKKSPGSKFMYGLKKAFPDEQLEKFLQI
jgi:transcriptional regulator with XRE-family HTH domain